MSDVLYPVRKVTDLQRELAARIVEIARARGMAAGDALRESVLARELFVSRTPVRAALDHLCSIGAAEHVPHRGYFLQLNADALPEVEFDTPQSVSRKVYNRLVDAYFEDELPDRISEAELMRRFGVERQPLHEALARLSAEGLIRPNPGYGWQISPLLKSREDETEDVFRFRLLLEPAVFLEPGYQPDATKLAELRAEQLHLLDTIKREFDVTLVYRANIHLHVALIAFCKNKFIINALDYDDPSDRINEYGHYQDRERTLAACHEHLAILDAVEVGDLIKASELMRAHIVAARQARPA